MKMAQKSAADSNRKLIADNRKARFNYEIEDTLEAGIELKGTEVKALREGKSMIAESYASFEGGEFWLINSYIPEYLQANRFNHEPRRKRKLLLHKREMAKLALAVDKDGRSPEALFQRKGTGQGRARTCARQEAARQARDRATARLEPGKGAPVEKRWISWGKTLGEWWKTQCAFLLCS